MDNLDNLDNMDFGNEPEPLEAPHAWQNVLLGMAAFTMLSVVAGLLIAQFVATRPFDLLTISDQTATSIEGFLVNHNIPADSISVSDPVLIKSPKAHYYQQDYIVHLPAHINPASIENTLERKMRGNDLVVTDYMEGREQKGLTISYGEFIFANVTFNRLNDTSALAEAMPDHPAPVANTPLSGVSLPKVNTAALLDKAALPAKAASPDKSGRTDVATIPEPETAPAKAPTPEDAAATSESAPKESYTGWVPADKRRDIASSPKPAESAEPAAPADDIELARVPDEKLTDPDETPTITPPQDAVAKLAIIVDDGGYGGALTDTILDLDNRLTLSILPNTPHGSAIAQLARERGFEVMLHMPMENADPDLKHPGQLNVDMSEDEIVQLTKDALEQIPQAVGVNNHTGSKYTTDPKAMALFLNAIKDLGLYFVDSKTTTETSAFRISKAFGLPSAQRDLFLDHVNDEAEIRQRFREAIELAKTQGEAIVICHFRPETAEVLEDIVPTLQSQGITLVPASELVQ